MVEPILRDVSKQMPAPPYPEDVCARGYSFMVDMTRIEQSRTWTIAPAELRPWLLLLWCRSWQQIPTGSLPDDDEVVAALLGMPGTMFAAYRRTLMAGWERASDGRLYHRVVTERVLEMLRTRKHLTERQRAWREKQRAQPTEEKGVTRDSRVSHALVTPRIGIGIGIGNGEVQHLTSPAARPTPSPAEAEPKRSKATRLPTDWKPTEEQLDFAASMLPSLARPQLIREAMIFRDYWTAKAGKDATKLDWQATWRNWIRRKQDDNGSKR